MFIINTFSTCFRHHYAHLQVNKTCVTACGVLRWFCWMWLVAVTVTFTVLAPYNAVPHNCYQPHPAEPAQHTTCSNTCLVHLKMGIMMPETCWESIDNKHLTVVSCWFSLSLHNFLTMHGYRNLKPHSYNTELHYSFSDNYGSKTCGQGDKTSPLCLNFKCTLC